MTIESNKNKKPLHKVVKDIFFYVNACSVITLTFTGIILTNFTCDQSKYMEIENKKPNIIQINNTQDTIILQIIEQTNQKIKTKEYILR